MMPRELWSTDVLIAWIDREIALTELLYADCVCMVCGESGRPHTHWMGKVGRVETPPLAGGPVAPVV